MCSTDITAKYTTPMNIAMHSLVSLTLAFNCSSRDHIFHLIFRYDDSDLMGLTKSLKSQYTLEKGSKKKLEISNSGGGSDISNFNK